MISPFELVSFFEDLRLDPQDMEISSLLIKEIRSRLQFLNNVGLGYLTLSRRANTLSGGESQRIRLATQIGSGLMVFTQEMSRVLGVSPT